MIVEKGSRSLLFSNTQLLSWKGKWSDLCRNKWSFKIQWKWNIEVDKTHKRSRLVPRFANMGCRALILCSCYSFATFLRLVCTWHCVCSTTSWYNTESAHYPLLYSKLTKQWRRESAARARSIGWHIVKDSRLIIPLQWHGPASPFRLSGRTKAGVWFLCGCYMFWVG